MEKSKTTPDAFLATLPEDVRDQMQTLDTEIARIMKGRARVLWEGKFWGGSDQRIIGYGDISYRGSSGKTVEWFLTGLAAQKNYITVFVGGFGDGATLAESYKKRLGKVKVGRSSISFKQLSDLDLEALKELVAKAREVMPST